MEDKMKKLFFSTVAALGCLGIHQAIADDQVQFYQLPQPVQQTINSDTSHGAIRNIERMVQNGRTNYQVTYLQKDGTDRNVWIQDNGYYMRGRGRMAGPPAASSTNLNIVAFNSVPQAVQTAINGETGHGPVQ